MGKLAQKVDAHRLSRNCTAIDELRLSPSSITGQVAKHQPRARRPSRPKHGCLDLREIINSLLLALIAWQSWFSPHCQDLQMKKTKKKLKSRISSGGGQAAQLGSCHCLGRGHVTAGQGQHQWRPFALQLPHLLGGHPLWQRRLGGVRAQPRRSSFSGRGWQNWCIQVCLIYTVDL